MKVALIDQMNKICHFCRNVCRVTNISFHNASW